jgi:hypothetical protein
MKPDERMSIDDRLAACWCLQMNPPRRCQCCKDMMDAARRALLDAADLATYTAYRHRNLTLAADSVNGDVRGDALEDFARELQVLAERYKP